MTVIVGLVENGSVIIGGDSAAVAGMSLARRCDRKVFRNGEFLIGYTTSFRMGQLLQHAFQPPRRHADEDLHRYMITSFIDGVRSCLKDGGFARRDSDVETGGIFLVGVAGRLFEVESDYQVGERLTGYAAIGCASDIALGSLHSTGGVDGAKRVKMALCAADEFSAGVCGPFVIETI